MEVNGWDSTPQEILVSTPRRFGKTISVSMFAAAMLYSCPNMELSIYSTCKRISQKLLRNVVKFLELIFLELQTTPFRKVRMNQVTHVYIAFVSLANCICVADFSPQRCEGGGPSDWQ